MRFSAIPYRGLLPRMALGMLSIISGSSAAVTVSALTPSNPSPQPVGTTVTWTATASDTTTGTLQYRFAVKDPSGALTIVRDYHTNSTFQWTPSQREGLYFIQVTVRNVATREAGSLSASYAVLPRVSGNTPVVSRTAHPLVALYSAPPCPAGSTIAVFFKQVGGTYPDVTNQKRCNGTESMNFYIAGMLPETLYVMSHKVITGANTEEGPAMYFLTLPIPAVLEPALGTVTGVRPITSQTSLAERMILHDYITQGTAAVHFPVATDLLGHTKWYYPAVAPQVSRFMVRPLVGGTMLIHLEDPTVTTPNELFQADQIWREFDLAGNTVRETNIAQVAAQVGAKYPSWNICNWTSPVIPCTPNAPPVYNTTQTAMLNFHHDSVRLPNGHTLILVSTEKQFSDAQGGTPEAPVDIVGDMVVDLDENMQVAWAWNDFAALDIHRAAVMSETCTADGPGCPPLNFQAVAHDWTHSNSLFYVPSDGSILVSMRHQDWVVKVNYGNSTGDGSVVWRLGKDGDFTMVGTNDPYPWFSHQHHAGFDGGTTNVLSLFDNGNTRVAPPPGAGLGGNSRGYVIGLNYANMTVRPLLLADLGNLSPAVCSAQLLSNGNYSFGSGFINPGGNTSSQSIEVIPSPAIVGTLDYTLRSTINSYRDYRLVNLYSGSPK